MPDARLIELIYAGLSDAAHWQTFLDEFRLRLRASQAIFSIAYPDESNCSQVHSSGFTEQDKLDLAQWGPEQDPWMTRIDWSTAYAGEFRASQDICPDHILEATPMYRQLLGPRGWHYGGGLLLGITPRQKALLTAVRPKEQGPYDGSEVEFQKRLAPHLVRVTAMHDERMRLRAEHASASALLDSAGTALLLLSEKSEIRYANKPAERLLASGRLIYSDAGYLRTADPNAQTKLLQLVARIGLPMSDEPSGSLVISDEETTFWITANRVAQPGESSLAFSAPAVALSITNPSERPRPVVEPLQGSTA